MAIREEFDIIIVGAGAAGCVLRSADPADLPRIALPGLTESADVERWRRATATVSRSPTDPRFGGSRSDAAVRSRQRGQLRRRDRRERVLDSACRRHLRNGFHTIWSR